MPFDPDLQARIDKARAGIGNTSGDDELSRLRAKLAAREGNPGFKDNVIAIKARIAELQGE